MQTNSHLSRLIQDQAMKYGDREELIYKDFGGTEWKSMSWNQFSDTVKQVSNAMLNLGIKVQENVGIFSQNSVQYLFCDFGAWGIRAVTIPFYATSSEQQIQFMVGDAQIRFLFVGEQEQYDKARRVASTCKTLERIIVFDQNVRLSENDSNAMYFDDGGGEAAGRGFDGRYSQYPLYLRHYGRLQGCDPHLWPVCCCYGG